MGPGLAGARADPLRFHRQSESSAIGPCLRRPEHARQAGQWSSGVFARRKTVYYTPHARTDSVVPRVVARELGSGAERAVYSAPRGSSVLASHASRDGKTLMVALVHKLREHPYKILAVSIASGAVRDLSAKRSRRGHGERRTARARVYRGSDRADFCSRRSWVTRPTR